MHKKKKSDITTTKFDALGLTVPAFMWGQRRESRPRRAIYALSSQAQNLRASIQGLNGTQRVQQKPNEEF